MANVGVDISQLSEERQLALQQFTAVTDQELKDAVPLLERCQWNVQIAIARFFDGEPPEDPVSAAPPPQDIRRQEVLLNNFNSPRSSTSSRGVRIQPAPRIVPQPESQVTTQAPLVLTILLTPFNLVYSLFSKLFRFAGWLFPPLARLLGSGRGGTTSTSRRTTSGRRPLNPRDTASRFVREFGEEYGAHTLPFFEAGYAQAFDIAKRDLKFLLVVLISPEHDDTTSFNKDTLLAQEVVDFIRDPSNNILLWAGNVQDSEAYQVAISLNCTKFPFVGLVVHTPQISSTAMGIATRVAGPTPPAQLIAKLRTAMQTHSEALNRIRAQRNEQQATRSIRQQQDSAYERSLATDRERARKKKEEAERKAREEKESADREAAAQRYAANLASWRQWRAAKLDPEPSPSTPTKDVARISLRMPSGERIVRRFQAAAPMEELYAFVECYAVLQARSENESQDSEKAPQDPPAEFEHEYKFRLVSPMPREVYALEDGGDIGSKVGRSGNLIVEKTDLEEEEGEEDDGNEDASAVQS